jgi:trehalose 6-phosphate synthase/phosphatase
LRKGSNPPAKSIVDDLINVKSRNPTPAAMTPAQENINPFSKAFLGTTTPRKRQTAHSDHRVRAQRKPSRSSSRRPESELSIRDEWHVEHNPHCNGGLKNAIVSMGDKLKKKLWVGTVGSHTDSFSEPLRHAVDKKMLVEQACVPVWIPDAEFESCYDEFCHQVLWPCLHYAIPDAPKTKMFYESASFKQYVAVNQRFADTIAANYQDGDISTRPVLLLPALIYILQSG